MGLALLKLAVAACILVHTFPNTLVGQQRVSSQPSRILLRPCKVPGITEDVRCGSYDVYEDRIARSGRKIALNIVIVPSLSSAALPDPLFWIDGGPGLGSANAAPLAGNWFSEVRKTRDLVFVDLRGTGKSGPLNCDIDYSPQELQKFFGAQPIREKLLRCRQTLEKNVDLRQYTTSIAMDDLDDVRTALGYGKINVAGMSYGSLAAQIYLRQHGDHVRSVFLAGTITPMFWRPLGWLQSTQHALDLLFEDCAADATCNAEFPNLRAEFNTVLTRFKEGPVRTDLIRPSDKRKQSVRISLDSFTLFLIRVLADTRNARLVPFVIHRAFENDYIPFEAAPALLIPVDRIARGLNYSVNCAEWARFTTEEDFALNTVHTFIDDRLMRETVAACKEWPVGDVPPSYVDPVKSDAPVLMISGEADPIAGSWFAADAVRFFPNGLLITIRNFAHQFGDPCVKTIFSAFIQEGSAVGLDASCTNSIRRPPFATELPARFSLQ